MPRCCSIISHEWMHFVSYSIFSSSKSISMNLYRCACTFLSLFCTSYLWCTSHRKTSIGKASLRIRIKGRLCLCCFGVQMFGAMTWGTILGWVRYSFDKYHYILKLPSKLFYLFSILSKKFIWSAFKFIL